MGVGGEGTGLGKGAKLRQSAKGLASAWRFHVVVRECGGRAEAGIEVGSGWNVWGFEGLGLAGATCPSCTVHRAASAMWPQPSARGPRDVL